PQSDGGHHDLVVGRDRAARRASRQSGGSSRVSQKAPAVKLHGLILLRLGTCRTLDHRATVPRLGSRISPVVTGAPRNGNEVIVRGARVGSEALPQGSCCAAG